MNATFTQVMEELHRQYVLGFMPKTLDGKEHKLDVKVKRSGVKVRSRKKLHRGEALIMKFRHRLAPVAALFAGVTLYAQTAAPPPQQAPTFRTGVRTVAVPASVFDDQGEIVTTLKRDDFLIFDDNKRQELTIFESGQQPITALVLIDTSASMIPRLDLAKLAAEQFIVRLWPGDKARVGSFSDKVQLLGDFTDNRDLLLRQIRDDLQVGNPTRMIDAIAEGMSALAPLPGRRVLIVVSDGCDTTSHAEVGRAARTPARGGIHDLRRPDGRQASAPAAAPSTRRDTGRIRWAASAASSSSSCRCCPPRR